MDRIVKQVQSAADQRRGSKKGAGNAEDMAMEAWQKEHKMRTLEMQKSEEKSANLTDAGKGKHFIGDFLPPDELAKFMEKVKAIKEGRKAGTLLHTAYNTYNNMAVQWHYMKYAMD